MLTGVDVWREHGRWPRGDVVEFRLLGPVEVWGPAGPVDVGPVRQRSVLAALVVDAGRLVPVETVVDRVWGSAPPDRARHTLYVYIARLRHALGPPVPLLSRSGGYVLDVDPDRVDAHRFRRLVEQSRDPSCASAQRVALLAQALDLWRGTPLADLPNDWAGRVREGWRQQRLDAAVGWAQASLALGGSDRVVAQLTDLAVEYPLAEPLVAVLMRALHASGRSAEALDWYARIRRRLAEELGVDPGADLRALHRTVLRGEPAAPPVQVAVSPRRCLPRNVADFTGREAAVAELVKAVPDKAPGRPAVAVISAVDGMAGIGKTALAVHVAHLVADRYPDAQLFVDLYGHSERAPLEPAAALGALLRQLGVAADRIPEPLDERVAMWRTELAGRRVLVVLDNAADTAQVLPLLPGSPSSLTLVTSRRRLVGLDGVHPVSLEVLSAHEAVLLLERVVGDRVSADGGAAADVARLCGYLPLAVRLAAARLAHRPRWSVADLARRLREATPLAELAADGRTVAAAFTLSYQHLGPEPQRVFRLLGLIPGADFDAYVAAALADVLVAQAAAILEDLDDAHLIEAKSADRYRLHDLLRDYAHDLVTATEPEPARHGAIERLLDYYVHAAASATEHNETPGIRIGLDLTSVRKPQTPPLETFAEAGTWLNAEWQNAIAAVHLADELDWHAHTQRLSRAIWAYLWQFGHNLESVQVHERVLAAMQRIDDEANEAATRNYLASGYFRLGRPDSAVDQLTSALQILRRGPDRNAQAAVLGNLGVVHRFAGRLAEAFRCFEEATTLTDLAKLRVSRTDDMAIIYIQLGRYAEALKLARANLALACEFQQPYGYSLALSTLGVAHHHLGHHKLAVALLTRARRIKREIHNWIGEAETLSDLGLAYRSLGRSTDALRCQQEALAIARELSEPGVELRIANDLAAMWRALGNMTRAAELSRYVLDQAGRTHQRYALAKAHDGLAAALCESDPAAAREHWQQALALYTEMGVPSWREVERNLEELEAHQ